MSNAPAPAPAAGETAAPVEAAPAVRGLEGERRIVTILFCDVQGSTAMAERLDPEVWAEIMNGAFAIMNAAVHRYEGTLARLMGDAILAFFGAPVAHEDDPRRAVLAGLDLVAQIQPYRERVRRAHGGDFNVRVGINTGLVVVGEMGSELRAEYTAMGDAVNLAARMEQTARPGTVQIAAPTYRLVAPLFEVEPLGAIEVKGKAERVEAYRVLRQRDGAATTRGIAGLRSPLVGRERQLQRLCAAVADLEAGQGQVISVIGEAGLGKSRLVAELRERTAGASLSPSTLLPAPSFVWLEGRSFSYEAAIPYAPFRYLLGRHFDLHGGDGEPEQYAQVRAGVEAVLPERAKAVAPSLAALLGLPTTGAEMLTLRDLDPQALQQRVFQATSDYLEGLAARTRPGGLVLVLEDLHWADPTSVDLLESLLPLANRAAVLILALFRPQREELAWRFHERAARDYAHRYTAIPLEPLDEAGTRTLVANLLQVEDLPERVRGLILEKAEGNPFYVEEVIRSLLDAGLLVEEEGRWRATREIERLRVPETLVGVITARLDRLERPVKQVAQAASVIGRAFARDVLAEVEGDGPTLDRALTDLERRELIREVRRLPASEFMFKHVLIQEAAYASVLLARRRAIHRRVAEFLERTQGDMPDTHLAALAHHAYEGGAWEKALDYGRRMGERSQALYASQAAIAHYTRALEAARRLDRPAPLDLLRTRGQAHETVGDFEAARADYQSALARARDEGNQRVEWQALLDLGFLCQGWDLAHAGAYFEEALALARALGDRPLLARSLNRFGNWLVHVNRALEGLRAHEEALAIFRGLDDLRGMAETFDLLGLASVFSNNIAGGIACFEQAIGLYDRLADRRGQIAVLTAVAYFGGMYLAPVPVPDGRRPAEALRRAERALAMAREIGWRSAEANVQSTLAENLMVTGAFGRALEAAREGTTIAEAIRHEHWTLMGHNALAHLYLELQAFPEALRHAETAVARAEKGIATPPSRVSGMMLASSCIAGGDLERAATLIARDAAMEAPTSLASLMAVTLRSALALSRGDAPGALATLEPLVALAKAPLVPSPILSLYWGEALAAAGRPEEAERALQAARRMARARGIRPALWRIDAALGRIFGAQSRAEEAERAFAEARATLAALAEEIPDMHLRETFLANATRRIASPGATPLAV
jgi:class 3 adenylate cyclase/tetratricopeptide (TPR) repeat protein